MKILQSYYGIGEIVRYVDDAVFAFSDLNKAKEFREALEKRFEEFKLNLNADKSGIRQFGPKDRAGNLPFVGFALYWGKAWKGKDTSKPAWPMHPGF